MLNFKNEDERVISEKRKVQGEAFQILIVFLIISLVVQKFFLNAPVEQILVELIGLIGAGLYVEVRNLTSGNYTFNLNVRSKSNIVKQGVRNTLIATIIFFFLSGIRDVSQIISFLLGFAAISIGFSLIIIYFNKIKEKSIEAELNEDEDISE